ncbi:MAG: hypothetical protein NTW96_02855 [Planctomycetia bacterium]|nr:hypothetical protein [Planctomycetia bacterium]
MVSSSKSASKLVIFEELVPPGDLQVVHQPGLRLLLGRAEPVGRIDQGLPEIKQDGFHQG